MPTTRGRLIRTRRNGRIDVESPPKGWQKEGQEGAGDGPEDGIEDSAEDGAEDGIEDGAPGEGAGQGRQNVERDTGRAAVRTIPTRHPPASP